MVHAIEHPLEGFVQIIDVIIFMMDDVGNIHDDPVIPSGMYGDWKFMSWLQMLIRLETNEEPFFLLWFLVNVHVFVISK